MTDKKLGFICGGVISKSLLFSDFDAYQMAYYMEDDRFEEYKALCADKTMPERECNIFFKKHARSAI